MKHVRERCLVLEAFSWEACEDHLGVTLIQSGRHRYRHNEAGYFLSESANKGGTARLICLVPLPISKGRAFVVRINDMANREKERNGKNESDFERRL